MSLRMNRSWAMLMAAGALVLCVLGLYQPGSAAPRGENEPFANAVEQRAEMIAQLREINALLKEQNALLRSGGLRVVVAEPPQP
jgi:type II secretory pathway component PulM